MKNGKVFIVNGRAKTNPPKPPSPPTSVLSPMTLGGWGDPHLYITISSADSKNRTSTKTIAQVGDNKLGSAGNNELILLDLQTTTDTIKIYYTNKPYINTAKIIDNIRVEYNGVSTTYSSTTKATIGPVTLSIAKIGSGANSYLNFEITWAKINNVVKLGGALVPILKKVANSNGQLWNGGDGAAWDGIGKTAASYGLNRSSFETGMGAQSELDQLYISADEMTFIENALAEIGIQNTSVFDNLQNLGENGEGNNAAIGDWDATHADVSPILSQDNGLVGHIDSILDPTATPTMTPTSTPTSTPTNTPTRTPTTTPTPSKSYTIVAGQWYNEIP